MANQALVTVNRCPTLSRDAKFLFGILYGYVDGRGLAAVYEQEILDIMQIATDYLRRLRGELKAAGAAQVTVRAGVLSIAVSADLLAADAEPSVQPPHTFEPEAACASAAPVDNPVDNWDDEPTSVQPQHTFSEAFALSVQPPHRSVQPQHTAVLAAAEVCSHSTLAADSPPTPPGKVGLINYACAEIKTYLPGGGVGEPASGGDPADPAPRPEDQPLTGQSTGDRPALSRKTAAQTPAPPLPPPALRGHHSLAGTHHLLQDPVDEARSVRLLSLRYTLANGQDTTMGLPEARRLAQTYRFDFILRHLFAWLDDRHARSPGGLIHRIEEDWWCPDLPEDYWSYDFYGEATGQTLQEAQLAAIHRKYVPAGFTIGADGSLELDLSSEYSCPQGVS